MAHSAVQEFAQDRLAKRFRELVEEPSEEAADRAIAAVRLYQQMAERRDVPRQGAPEVPPLAGDIPE